MRKDDLTGEEYQLVKGHGLVYQEKLAASSTVDFRTFIQWTRSKQRQITKRAGVK